MKGSYPAFGVTNYWEIFSFDVQQGKNLADAAKVTMRYETFVIDFVFACLRRPQISKVLYVGSKRKC
jgi:hypothetical protein